MGGGEAARRGVGRLSDCPPMAAPPAVTKRGAGLLLVDSAAQKVLLLVRGKDSGNPGTLGLPGGNLDEGEDSWAACARECEEEIGGAMPPGFDAEAAKVRPMVTRRGKALQKEYTVFAANCDSTKGWTPTLNDEHSAHAWVDIPRVREAAAKGTAVEDVEPPRALHPVVTALFLQYPQCTDVRAPAAASA